MGKLSDQIKLRVRYGETDQMGTFYNGRALDWFECGRSELIRNRLGMSYAAMEERGFYLPVVEAHLEFLGRAQFDDLLQVNTTADWLGRARLRFEVEITQTEGGRGVVRGYTIHAFTDKTGKPVRPPRWFIELMQNLSQDTNP